jgi:hypothetical protein
MTVVKHRAVGLAGVVGLAVLLVPLLAIPAFAHEPRDFGRYHVEVGFGDEPPYIGEKNSVQLLLSDKAGKPITNLGDTLKVEVSTEGAPGAPLTLAMEPNFEVGGDGIPGDYRAWFVPTTPGKYTFHFTGTIHGDKVDQQFTSSKTGFDEVQDPAQVEYPTKQPSSGQLATRLDREVPRLDAALASGRQHAQNDSNRANLIAVIGVVVGLLGVGIGAVALVTARRSTAQHTPPPKTSTPAGRA